MQKLADATYPEQDRAGGIRTHDLLNPIQAHYQAVLRPDVGHYPLPVLRMPSKVFAGTLLCTRWRISLIGMLQSESSEPRRRSRNLVVRSPRRAPPPREDQV